MSNKRRAPRIKRRLSVRFRSEGGHERSAFTADISRDGLYVTCTAPEIPGRLLEIEVDVPGTGAVQLTGVVVWCRKVPRQLQSVQRGGFGVEIRLSPWEWAELFEQLEAATG
jgi:hypothetical protein